MRESIAGLSATPSPGVKDRKVAQATELGQPNHSFEEKSALATGSRVNELRDNRCGKVGAVPARGKRNKKKVKGRGLLGTKQKK
jgi:hypothetical protein